LHEFALAQDLLKVIELEAKRRGAVRVEEVRLRIGKLAMITSDSLLSAFELVSKGSIAENAHIDVEEEGPQVTCKDCGTRLVSDTELMCPACKGTRLAFSGGTDIKVMSLRTSGDKDI